VTAGSGYESAGAVESVPGGAPSVPQCELAAKRCGESGPLSIVRRLTVTTNGVLREVRDRSRQRLGLLARPAAGHHAGGQAYRESFMRVYWSTSEDEVQRATEPNDGR